MPDEMFAEAVQAAKAGQRMRAKDLLARLIKVDQSNPDYWLWMSAVVDTEKEQVFCLQNALKLDPNSIPARRGMVVLGAMKPEESGLPPATTLESRHVAIPELTPGSGLGGLLANRRSREMLAIVGVGLVATVAVVIACLAVVAPGLFRPKSFVVVTSAPAGTQPAGPTASAAAVAGNACEIPAIPDPATPLAVYLCLTQTPTPVAVATEASLSENYTNLKKYYHDSDWTSILSRVTAILADPNVPQSAHVYFYLAEAYRHTGDLANAFKNYQTATQKDSGFAPAYWGRALVEIAQNKSPAALADFDRAIAADASFVASYLDRASFYSLTGNDAGALTDLQQAQLAAPRNALVLARLAIAYVDNGQAQQGLDRANAALAIDPGLALGYFARGRAEYAQSAYHAADLDLSQSYRYVLAVDSPLPTQFQATVLSAAALAKAADGDEPTALALLSQAIGLDRNNARLYLVRGGLLLGAKRFDEARADFASAVSQLQKTAPKDPSLVEAYLGLGQAFLGLNRPNDAVNSYQAAVRLAPESFPASLGLGQAMLAAGQTDAAIGAFSAALGLASDRAGTAQGYYWRAQAYRAAGNTEAEVADLDSCRSLADSGNPLVPTAVARLTDIGPLPTHTATPTETAVTSPTNPPTRTPTLTRTPVRSATPSPTRTPARSPTPSPTQAAPVSATPPPSQTSARSPTPSPTQTPAGSPTRTPTRTQAP